MTPTHGESAVTHEANIFVVEGVEWAEHTRDPLTSDGIHAVTITCSCGEQWESVEGSSPGQFRDAPGAIVVVCPS